MRSSTEVPKGRLKTQMTDRDLARVINTFDFIVRAPLPEAAPLFGPEAECGWAGAEWNPEFLYPQPGRDLEGAVFRVRRGSYNSIWVNTLFDLDGGHMQYVAFIADLLVTTVDVRLTPLDPASTKVEVTYTRTALEPAANEHVEILGNNDRNSGPQWQQAIEACLATQNHISGSPAPQP
jgi:hypothetical protein